jgi:hypothetical protein
MVGGSGALASTARRWTNSSLVLVDRRCEAQKCCVLRIGNGPWRALPRSQPGGSRLGRRMEAAPRQPQPCGVGLIASSCSESATRGAEVLCPLDIGT